MSILLGSIICPKWQLPLYDQKLTEAKFPWTIYGQLDATTLALRVSYDPVHEDKLIAIVQAVERESEEALAPRATKDH